MVTCGTHQHKHILLHFIFNAVNIPLRDYQFAITKKALFSNTLVALPTGLGKTLIAAVVMYNYFRWFPEGNLIIILLLNHTFHDFYIIWLHNFSVLEGIFLERGRTARVRLRVCFLARGLRLVFVLG